MSIGQDTSAPWGIFFFPHWKLQNHAQSSIKIFIGIITGHFLVRIEAQTHGMLRSKQPCVQGKAKGVWGQPFLA